MGACPHCGFTNKPNATRCECCLAELVEAEPIRAAAAAASAPRVSTAASGSTRGATPTPFHPVEPGEPAPQLSVQPPAISPEVGGRGAKLVLALVVVGVLCGIWLLRPQPGKPSLARTILDGTKHEQAARPSAPASSEVPAKSKLPARRRGVVSLLVSMLFSEKSAPPAQPAAPPESQPPVAGTREPAAVPPANVPATRPATPVAPPVTAAAPAGGAPAVPTAEPEAAAGALYKAAVAYLKRNQVEKARNALQEIARKYPQTTVAAQAQDLLNQLPMLTPAQPPPASAGVSTAAARPRPAPSASRPVEPAPPAPGPATGGPERPTPRKPVIPPSLLASQAPVPASAAARDEVRVTGALREDRSLVITLACVLDSGHSRPVFLGAWLRDASGMQRVGYAATRISSGRSAPKLTLMNVPDTLTQLRVVLFEENGALFLTRDFTLSK